VAAYADPDPPEWAFGDAAGSHADLAVARMASRDLDGAAEAIAPVLELPPERRIRGIISSARHVYDALRRAGLSDDGKDLQEEMELFTRTPVKALPTLAFVGVTTFERAAQRDGGMSRWPSGSTASAVLLRYRAADLPYLAPPSQDSPPAGREPAMALDHPETAVRFRGDQQRHPDTVVGGRRAKVRGQIQIGADVTRMRGQPADGDHPPGTRWVGGSFTHDTPARASAPFTAAPVSAAGAPVMESVTSPPGSVCREGDRPGGGRSAGSFPAA